MLVPWRKSTPKLGPSRIAPSKRKLTANNDHLAEPVHLLAVVDPGRPSPAYVLSRWLLEGKQTGREQREAGAFDSEQR